MGEGPFPVILSIHGGAFKSGDKGDGQVTAMLEGLKRGYAVVPINYRLSGEAIFPAQIYDVKAVVDWFGPTDFLKMDEQLKESKVTNPQTHSIPDSPAFSTEENLNKVFVFPDKILKESK